MDSKFMSPLEEAAREWVNEEYWKDPTRPVKVTDSLTEKVFIAGALWLSEEIKTDLQIRSEGFAKYVLDRLEELCQSEEE